MMKIDMNLKCSLNDVHDHMQQTQILAAMINKFESFLVNDSHTSYIQHMNIGFIHTIMHFFDT